MEITLRLNLTSREDWRKWLTNNHNTQKECWLSVTRGKSNNAVLYLDASLYQRIRIGNIQYYRRRKLEYQTKLDRFITQTRQNIIYGDWHDNGRLL